MASITNLEDLPQLVMEKITSFLDHKQLLAFEQTSRKLKSAVDAHFSTTDQLIIGPLPEIECYDKVSAKDKKCLDGLLKIITRCGIRLRTIQITTTMQFPLSAPIANCRRYCRYFFVSTQVSSTCPNIENILACPNVDIITILDNDMFRSQNVLLDENVAERYAKNIKLSTGGTCRLRSIKLSYRQEKVATDSYQRIVSLFSNLEQIFVWYADDNFYKILPQLMDNGLKDLSIIFEVDSRIAKKLCNICKDLRTLRFGLYVENIDDVSALNKLQLPKNVELRIIVGHVDNFFAHLNETVCDSIINCEVYGPTDFSLMSKFKNLQEFNITNSGRQLQVIAEGSFPKLRRIQSRYLCSPTNCGHTSVCSSQTFLAQLLINKGNQLTHIDLLNVCKGSMPKVWKAFRDCKAAKSIRVYSTEMESPLTVTFGDVAAICDLPNLQHFIFAIRKRKDDEGLLGTGLGALLQRAVKENSEFQVEYKFFKESYYDEAFSLYRIHF